MTTPYVDPQTIHNPSTGINPPASWGDTVRDDLEFLIHRPGCRVARTTAQELTDSTVTAIEFTATDLEDTDAYHSTSSNTSRLTIPSGLGGVYRVAGMIEFEVNGSNFRMLGYRINGSEVRWMQTATADFEPRISFSEEVELAVGAYVELIAYQNSGVALDATAARFGVRWEART